MCNATHIFIGLRFGDGYTIKVWLDKKGSQPCAVSDCLKLHFPGIQFKVCCMTSPENSRTDVCSLKTRQWWLVKGRIPLMSNLVKQWACWGYLQDCRLFKDSGIIKPGTGWVASHSDFLYSLYHLKAVLGERVPSILLLFSAFITLGEAFMNFVTFCFLSLLSFLSFLSYKFILPPGGDISSGIKELPTQGGNPNSLCCCL